MNKKPYRSKELKDGSFDILGSSHVHIDTSRIEGYVEDILREMERTENYSEISHVYNSIAGPQREMLKDVYHSHTPVINDKEELEFFSATVVHDRNDAIRCINFIDDALTKVKGAVIELEQVVGWFDQNGWKKLPVSDYMQPMLASDVTPIPAPTLKFEIHHTFYVPKTTVPPVSLDELSEYSKKNGIIFGGWFIFEEEKTWGYSSNSFTDDMDFSGQVEEENRLISLFVEQQGFTSSVQTLIEQVVGIWQANM